MNRKISYEREAEELRSGVEKLISDARETRCLVEHYADDTVVLAIDLQDLLDRVDARDSLKFLEARDLRKLRRDRVSRAKKSKTMKTKKRMRTVILTPMQVREAIVAWVRENQAMPAHWEPDPASRVVVLNEDGSASVKSVHQ